MTGGLVRRAGAELIGTAFLLMAVVGSGIAAQRLSPHDIGLELFENSTATGVALVAIILAFGPVSGAHLNPAVSLVNRLLGGMSSAEMLVYWASQLVGGLLGTVLANLMFSVPAIEISSKQRWGAGLWLAEIVATFGLVLVIFAVARSAQSGLVAVAVGAYIAGAYWFTASTSFANPAVTLARTLTPTFAGIAPASVLPFLAAQLVGALLAAALIRWLYQSMRAVAPSGSDSQVRAPSTAVSER
jgi:glycerol uptake facilitator-like aquaporin